MIKLYDENFSGYVEAEVKDFYCNDLPVYFAKTDKDSYVRNFSAPFYPVPKMIYGSKPTDGGNLILSPEERDELVAKNPAAEKWIRPFLGSLEFIRGKKRFCLWLEDCPPNELRKMPRVMKRVEAVRDFRLASKKAATRRRAETPTLFTEDRFIDAPALLMPMVSGNRKYVPIGFVERGVIVSNKALFIPNADIFHFGVLTSSIHMAWM